MNWKQYLFFLTLSLSATLCSNNQNQPQNNGWHLMIYVAAHNSLDPHAEQLIEDLKNLAPTNVLVSLEIDRKSSNYIERYRLSQQGLWPEQFLERAPASSSGSPEAFDAFLTWAYQASNYYQNQALFISNHGSGIVSKNILFNDEFKTSITESELATALQKIRQTTNTNPLKFIAFDTCLTNMIEIMYLLKNETETIIASPDIAYPHGLHYPEFIKDLDNYPKNLSYVFKNLLHRFKVTNIAEQFSMYSLLVSQCSKIDAAFVALKAAIAELLALDFQTPEAQMVRKFNLIRCSTVVIQSYANPNYIDLGIWLNELAANSKHLAANPKTFSQACKNALKALNDVITVKKLSAYHKQKLGISIYYPITEIAASYTNDIFAQESGWLTFLQRLGLPEAKPPLKPAIMTNQDGINHANT